jgi:hypothetical protein
MGLTRRSLALLLVLTPAAPAVLIADIPYFTDSVSDTFYDPSWAIVSAPSLLALVNGDKLPVAADTFLTGQNSLRLSWRSREGGSWRAAVAAPGWLAQDLSEEDFLSIWLMSPSALSP